MGEYTSSLSRFYYDTETGKGLLVEFENNNADVQELGVDVAILTSNHDYINKPVRMKYSTDKNIMKLAIPHDYMKSNIDAIKEEALTPIKIEIKFSNQAGLFEKHLLNGLVYR